MWEGLLPPPSLPLPLWGLPPSLLKDEGQMRNLTRRAFCKLIVATEVLVPCVGGARVYDPTSAYQSIEQQKNYKKH